MFLYFLLIAIACNSNVLANTFTIGGLFHDDNYQSEIAFKYAIARQNTFSSDIQFDTKIRRINKTDSFAVKKIVCELVSADDGVVAIFGPESHVVSPMVESICTNLQLPHLTANYKPGISYTARTAINLYPDPELLGVGVATVVKTMNWKSYMIIYQNNEDLVRLQEVLKISTPDSPPVTIRQLSDSDDHRPLFRELQLSTEFNFILDCDKALVIDVLLDAKEVGMLKDFHNYLITDLDAHTLDFSVLEANANITVIRLVDPENPQLHNAVRDWELREQNNNYQPTILSSSEVTTEAALMYDAANFFTMSFREIDIREKFRSRPLSCEATEPWINGYRFATYMKKKSASQGLTGAVKFNEFGKRSHFTLEVAEVSDEGIEKTASWTPDQPDNLNFTRTDSERMLQILQRIRKEGMIVSSRIGAPYLTYRQPRYDEEILEGNDRYEGYSKDLMDELARVLQFTYRFEITEDGAYGRYNPETKSWNGLIRDLLERRAHLAIADLTITQERRAVVDFSVPFMTTGVGILHSRAPPSQKNVFPFMELDLSVWIYVASAYILVALAVYLIARMAPGDWEKPPGDKSPEILINKWTLKNSLWLMFSSTYLGCDIFPKGIASRMVISMWWLTIIIFTSGYTANLLGYLNYRKEPAISSIESLVNQKEIKYGAVNGGSTQRFFKDSNYSTYARMWTQMQTSPSVFVSSNGEGVSRVLTTKNQRYAFLMESSSMDYVLARNCELRQVGGRIDSKGYGIAMPRNSPFRSAINMAILRLQEAGKLAMLKNIWWKKGYNCDSYDLDEKYPSQLKLADFGGIFFVLLGGVVIAVLLSFVDFLWNVHVVSLEQKIPYKKAFILETKFAAKFWITKRKKPNNENS